MRVSLFFSFILLFLQACGQKVRSNSDKIQPLGTTIETRFNLPEGYKRIAYPAASYATYLRKLPLKPDGALVKFYDGQTKETPNVYAAVVDLTIGHRNLHQCADAIMRLRAEYFWNQQAYKKIHFNFTNGMQVDYSKWMAGNRIRVKGNKTKWVATAKPATSYASFWKYMEIIFSYAGTLSLAKELQPVAIKDMQIGDVFIQGGSPGHAIVVVDMAVHPLTKEKVFMLAQSYMPAQELQILQNPTNKALSPWYSANFVGNLFTPEWTFQQNNLKRF